MPDFAKLRQEWRQELSFRAGSWAVWAAVSLLSLTMQVESLGLEGIHERKRQGLPSIAATWHGRTLAAVMLFGPARWATMISLSRDGEYQARIFRRFGWDVVRGSSGRGGIRALAGAVRKLRDGAIFALTPDGPRGPSHVCHLGALFLSQKARCPLYPVGISSYPRWSLPTWDHYQIPYPFARSILIFGEPLDVPANASEAELEALGEELAARITALEQQADALARSRARRDPSNSGGAGEVSHPSAKPEP